MGRGDSSTHSSSRKKSKKSRTPPADQDTIFNMINELRQQCKLTPIKSQQGIDDYATMLVTDYQSADLNNDAYVIMSNMSFVEEFDGKTSAAELIQKWMGEPNRRPVLFAPGKQGSVQFVDLDGQIYISVVVVSFFH